MTITVAIDPDQTDSSDREKLIPCPECGQKLLEVRSAFHRNLFRMKCRRCRKYIRIVVDGGNE